MFLRERNRGLRIQRVAETGAAALPALTPASGASLIVEDGVADLAPNQMTRSAFLAQLRGAVCATAEEALAGTVWSAVGCPWIDRWFDYYGGQSAEHIEKALYRYAPSAAGAGSAAELIPIACARVRSAISEWTQTGEVPSDVQQTQTPEGEPPPMAMM